MWKARMPNMNEDAVERAEIDPVEAPYDHVSDDDDEEPEVRKSRSGHLCWLRMRGLARSEPRHRQVPLSMPLRSVVLSVRLASRKVSICRHQSLRGRLGQRRPPARRRPRLASRLRVEPCRVSPFFSRDLDRNCF